MISLELFCGTKSFSKVAASLGHKIFTVDIDARFKPDLVCDILDFRVDMLPDEFRNPNIIWASPPCTTFSVASIGHHWVNGKPSDECRKNLRIVHKTLEIIEDLNPKFWFIENPRGMLRKQFFMPNHLRRTVTYCQYGDNRMKPTDIWTNLDNWRGKICRNGSNCHISAPRGSKTGTQGLSGAIDRGVIPPALFYELFKVMNGGVLK